MILKTLTVNFLILVLAGLCLSQESELVLQEIKALAHMPAERIPIDLNGFELPAGGHFQGIQLHPDEEHLIISASSASKAYALTVELTSGKVVALHSLMEKPMKHAGGIQVCGDMVAIGIEDNAQKDSSVVCLYDIRVPFKWYLKESELIERSGAPMEQTAGAVACQMADSLSTLWVANWDANGIDRYHIENGSWIQTSLDKDPLLKAKYQNLQYWKGHLLGFYRDGRYNKIDLISMKADQLQLIETIHFKYKEGNFQFAAGVSKLRGRAIVYTTAGNTIFSYR